VAFSLRPSCPLGESRGEKMSEYNYKQLIEEEYKKIEKFQGKTLNEVYVHSFSGRIFMVYLKLENEFFMISGKLGSEYLGISENPDINEAIEERKGLKQAAEDNILEFQPFSIFLGKKIKQVRMMGEAWNGHGFEFSFEDLLDKTMIIQSIYAGDHGDSLFDCMRLGIGMYYVDYGLNTEE
jgi:hypothetical protein